jgi:hypothetical protein
MIATERFSIRRLFLLIKNDLFFNRSYLLISAAVVAGVLLIASSYHIYIYTRHTQLGMPKDVYKGVYHYLLFICGVIFTSKIFNEVHDDVKGAAWLTLPASPMERYVSRLILTTIILIVAMMSIFFVTSFILEIFNPLIFGQRHHMFNPFNKDILDYIYTYLSLQSLFLLGVVFFRKNALLKTLLGLIIYYFFIGVIVSIGGRILFDVPLSIFSSATDNLSMLIRYNSLVPQDWTLSHSAYWPVFWGIQPLICWYIGYLLLREAEV